ncbi:LysR family transcriptional regulator [Peptacetobacter sp. AB845]|uniref:LysR family transcriptional regulator n=1 Tax=Peptacetobacter sp. AB845 TaxID=3388429 RepID=UPI0039C95E4E
MNLYHLKYFVTLAHLEHYTKAAEQLSITQPSLSHAIASLEKEINIRLFEKDGRNIVLTRAGKNFLTDIEKALALIDESINSIHLSEIGEGYIDIAFHKNMIASFIPDLARKFLNEHTGEKIDFKFHYDAESTEDLVKGLYSKDFDFIFCSKCVNDKHLEYIPVFKQKAILLVPENHPLADKDSVKLEDTLEYNHILYTKSYTLLDKLSTYLNEKEKNTNISYKTEDINVIASLVAGDFGISIVPENTKINLKGVKSISISDLDWQNTVYMAYLKSSYEIPVIGEFKAFIKENAINL